MLGETCKSPGNRNALYAWTIDISEKALRQDTVIPRKESAATTVHWTAVIVTAHLNADSRYKRECSHPSVRPFLDHHVCTPGIGEQASPCELKVQKVPPRRIANCFQTDGGGRLTTVANWKYSALVPSIVRGNCRTRSLLARARAHEYIHAHTHTCVHVQIACYVQRRRICLEGVDITDESLIDLLRLSSNHLQVYENLIHRSVNWMFSVRICEWCIIISIDLVC